MSNAVTPEAPKMFSLSPKDEKFFDMFIMSARTMSRAAELLRKMMDDLNDPEEAFRKVKEEERKGDQQLHAIFEQLNRSFITPIDREDIYGIGKQMDDIADHIESAASRFVIYNITAATDEAKMVGDLIVGCTREMIALMEELKRMKKSKTIMTKIIEINRIEEECDNLYRKAIRDLFSGATPVIDIIKWKDIYERLEQSVDACEDVANIVEGVVMKYA
jgi:predicted phosphate transport protein (TIGR00153 family)